jgi:phage-related minor tail protein
MALQVGELYAALTLDDSEFNSGIDNAGSKFTALGGIVAGAFAGVMVGAVAALGGAIIGAVGSAASFQKSMNTLQTQTGATASEMEGMSKSVKDIYARNLGESFDDVATSMATVKQATGLAGKELESVTANALVLRDTFGYEVSESVRASDTMMKQFGMTGGQSMDMIAEATQKGLNKGDDLIDTIEEYSVYFKSAGLSGQDMFAIFESASKAGVRNLDYVGDAFKEFNIRAKDGSDATSEAFSALGLDAGKLGADIAAGGERGKAAFETTMGALAGVDDEVQRNQIGVALFGTKFEDLEAKAVLAMSNLDGTIKGTGETLKSINQIKYDDLGSAFAGIGRQLQVGILMPLGDLVLPLLNDFANWLAENIPAIVGFFSDMGTKIKEAFDKLGPSIEGATGIFQSIVPLWGTVFSSIWGVVGPILSTIGAAFMDLVSSILSWWKTNGAALVADFTTVFNGVMAVINFVLPFILAIVKSVFNNIKGAITGALNVISGVFKIFAGLFTGDWSKMWDGVKQLLKGAVQLIWNIWNLMLYGKLVKGVVALAKALASGFKSMGAKIVSFFTSMVSKVTGKASSMASSVMSKIKGLWNNFKSVFNTLRAFGASVWAALKAAVVNTVSKLASGVMTKITSMKSRVVDGFNSIKSRATTIFNALKGALTKPIESAKKTILGIIEKIKGAFNRMKIKIPKFKLPKISVSTKKGALGIPIPNFDVNWYKKGGVFNGPSMIGVGEAGDEAVVPLSGQRMRPFATEVAKQMGGNQGNNDGGGPRTIIVKVGEREIIKAIDTPMNKAFEQKRTFTRRANGKGK